MKIAIYVNDGQVRRVFLKGAPADIEARVFEYPEHFGEFEVGTMTKKMNHGDKSPGQTVEVISYPAEVIDFASTNADLLELFS